VDFVLSNLLRLFHPFLPFITEELWHGLAYNQDLPQERGLNTIMTATWPVPLSAEEKEYFGLDEIVDQLAAAKFELITLGRNLKAQFNVPSNKRVRFQLRPSGELSPREVEVFRSLLVAESVDLVSVDSVVEKGTPVAANSFGELYLPLAGVIDSSAERVRLGKELEKIRSEISKVREKLANPNFTQKVPASVLAEHQQRLTDWIGKEKQVEGSLANLPA
jgi:valyl-tRNA synthetase